MAIFFYLQSFQRSLCTRITAKKVQTDLNDHNGNKKLQYFIGLKLNSHTMGFRNGPQKAVFGQRATSPRLAKEAMRNYSVAGWQGFHFIPG